MAEAPFSSGNSLLHRADPRIKLVLCLILAFLVAGLATLHASFLALLAGAILVLSARLPLGQTLKRLLLVNGFIAFLWIMLPFSTPGETLFSLWRLEATSEGIRLAGLITLKSNAILLSIMALLATIPASLLGQVLTSLRVPDKLALVLILCYRYLHMIQTEYARLIQAARIRCFRPGTNLHTYRTYGYLLGMLLVNSYERGRRVHQAMRLRAFQGKFYSLSEFSLQGRDAALASFVLLLAFALLAVELNFQGHPAFAY